MKFEVKTQNDDLLKSSCSVLLSFAILIFIVVLSNISIKLGAISRHYEIKYLCNLLTIEKSSLNFKKLSNLTNQNTKQKMWDLCREIVK
jgi:hypothetical protein|tara:strand:+ start:616 stop:882 length:267 start_codon:yes stop_codon:yes gene_type:complete